MRLICGSEGGTEFRIQSSEFRIGGTTLPRHEAGDDARRGDGDVQFFFVRHILGAKALAFGPAAEPHGSGGGMRDFGDRSYPWTLRPAVVGALGERVAAKG